MQPESQLAAANPTPPKELFLTLPPEIRNIVYKYVTFALYRLLLLG